MEKYIIFGGSKGLGREIADRIDHEKNKKSIRCQREVGKGDGNFLQWDIGKKTKNEYYELYNGHWPLSGICFAQRYRGEKDCLDEFKVMVEGTAKAIEVFKELLVSRPRQSQLPRIIIVGSTYAERTGYDQGWSYHTAKSSQLALVRYFAVNSKKLYTINLVSPATYKKRGSEEFWEKSDKEKHWKRLAPGGLANIGEIADEITKLIINNATFLSGNNIYLDGGIHNLYHDQK